MPNRCISIFFVNITSNKISNSSGHIFIKFSEKKSPNGNSRLSKISKIPFSWTLLHKSRKFDRLCYINLENRTAKGELPNQVSSHTMRLQDFDHFTSIIERYATQDNSCPIPSTAAHLTLYSCFVQECGTKISIMLCKHQEKNIIFV